MHGEEGTGRDGAWSFLEKVGAPFSKPDGRLWQA